MATSPAASTAAKISQKTQSRPADPRRSRARVARVTSATRSRGRRSRRSGGCSPRVRVAAPARAALGRRVRAAEARCASTTSSPRPGTRRRALGHEAGAVAAQHRGRAGRGRAARARARSPVLGGRAGERRVRRTRAAGRRSLAPTDPRATPRDGRPPRSAPLVRGSRPCRRTDMRAARPSSGSVCARPRAPCHGLAHHVVGDRSSGSPLAERRRLAWCPHTSLDLCDLPGFKPRAPASGHAIARRPRWCPRRARRRVGRRRALERGAGSRAAGTA